METLEKAARSYDMGAKSRQVRGMAKHATRPGQVVPFWMLCWHTKDALCWAPLFRAHVLRQRKGGAV